MHPTDAAMTPGRLLEIRHQFVDIQEKFRLTIKASGDRLDHSEISLRQHIDNIRAAALVFADDCATI